MAATMAVSTVAFASAALAADMPYKGYGQPALLAPAYVSYNWSGFYAGVNLGYDGSTFSQSFNDPFTSISTSIGAKGFTYGVEAKYLYEFGNKLVLGAATDFNFGGGSGSQSVDNCPGCAGFSSVTANEFKKQWWGTTRAVLGYDLGAFMPYVTGGIAYASIKGTSVTNSTGGGMSSSFSAESTLKGAGYVIGTGINYRISPSWVASLEYLHMKYSFISQSDSSPSQLTSDLTDNVVRAGLHYHF